MTALLPVSCLTFWSTAMSQQPIELTLEQKFNLRSFETQVEKMSREQAQDFLVKLYEQQMVREAMYKDMLKQQWGIDFHG